METPDKRFPDLIDVVKSWMPWRNEPADISRDFWMPDDSCMVCYDCDAQFTIFNRRHHCRKCGRVFCAKCTTNSIPAKSIDSRNFSEEGERIRVCNYCFKQWEGDIAATSNEVQTSSPVLSPSSPSSASLTSTKSNGTGNSSSMTTVSFPYSNGAYQCVPGCYGPSSSQTVQVEACPDKQERSKSVTNLDTMGDAGDNFPDHFRYCFNRSDDDDDDEYGTCHSDSEPQGLLKSDEYYGPNVFNDADKYYTLNNTHSAEALADPIVNNPPLHDDSKSNASLDADKKEEHNLGKYDECDVSSPIDSLNSVDAESMDFENDRQLWLPPEPEEEEEDDESVLFDDEEDTIGEWRDLRLSSSFGSGEYRNKDRPGDEHKKAMRGIIDGHFRALVAQLLQVENLPLDEDGKESWLDIVTSLSWEAASLLKPDTSNGGGMDPGLYVKVKCLACGRPSDSILVKGVVCKKNVAHRRMTTKVEKSRLLLLGGALEYQRVTNLLSSFDTLLQQEMDHLKMAVAKIDAHHPNVLLVEKSVSRFAQEYLLSKNIALVLNVKRPLLERVARCTGAHIVPSIDHLSSPKLGNCDLFRVEKFLEEHGSAGQGGKKLLKTLMFFEGCPRPLGYTILLKGADNDSLKKIKHVVQYGVFAAYHLALETSFLADEGASLPELPLKSPITIALPDKPLSMNRSITMIPGFKVSTSEKQHAGSSLKKSDVSYSNFEFSDLQKAEEVIAPCLSDNHDQHSSDSFSTLLVPSAEMKDFPFGNSDLLGQIEAKNTMAPSVYLSPSGSLTDHSFINSRYYHKKEDKEKVIKHITPSVSLENLDTLVSGAMANDGQSNQSKFIQNQQFASDFRSSHHDNAGDFLTVQKEEFPPSPSDHQSILVSLSSRCVWKGTVCERAHLFRIKYYGSFDKPLGRYLRDHLFDQSYRCHSCEMPSDAHIYCYTHQQGSLTISVRKLQEFHLPGECDGKIWMWHRCLRCRRVKGFPPSTRRVVMSDAAWGLSFGKFLELSFSNHAAASRVASCGHSLHRDCLRFYGCGNMVACFRYAPINLHSVYLPPSKLDFNYQHQDWVQKEVDELVGNTELLFTEVLNLLRQVAEGRSSSVPPDGNGKLAEMRRIILHLEGLLQAEKAEFEESFEKVMKEEEKKVRPMIDILEINKLRRLLLFQSYIWDKRILSSKQSYSNAEELHVGVTKKKENIASNLHRSITSIDNTSKLSHPFNPSAISADTPERLGASQQTDVEYNHINEIEPKVSLSLSTNGNQVNSSEDAPAVRRVLSDGQFQKMVDLSDTLDAKWQGESGSTLTDGKSKTSASESSEEYSGADLIQPSASASQAKLGENLEEWMKTSALDLYQSHNKKFGYPNQLLNEDHSNHVLFKKLQRQCVGKLLLPLGVNNMVIPIYDDEPTSIISYALVCPDYQFQISDEPERCRDGRESSFLSAFEDLVNIYGLQSGDDLSIESLKSFESFDESISSMTSSKSSLVLDPLTSTKSMHVRVSFSDSEKVKYGVTCYYAKCFDALRRTCCPSEQDFVRSLSRCKKWGAQGGKSNVFFAKSLDDRFIIKQVTKTELESFIKFAPEYFKYLSESISTGSPTCLAKILGIYQVTIKNLTGGKESRIDVLVMENLLFGRQVTRLYDLKGSSRSRYNADSSGNNKVLLDQNLIEAMPTSPIFVGNKPKRLLERAVWNDTSFLASIDVMDYSLLVGIDEEKHELVLGIIDFMRQYTWDKHLETWVKTSGILGGTKNESPTVISPMQYKKRFRKAMSAYFLVVPDQWSPPAIITSNSQSSHSQEKTLDASSEV